MKAFRAQTRREQNPARHACFVIVPISAYPYSPPSAKYFVTFTACPPRLRQSKFCSNYHSRRKFAPKLFATGSDGLIRRVLDTVPVDSVLFSVVTFGCAGVASTALGAAVGVASVAWPVVE